MSHFAENGLNGWRLTKRESRLFPPDSLKFHSFVIEAGSELPCRRNGSPKVRKNRLSTGEASAARLTFCGCHVENIGIISALKHCLDVDTCIPDCGCRFGESSDGAGSSPVLMSGKVHQMRRSAVSDSASGRKKRRSSSDPRDSKVAKVSGRQDVHSTVSQKRNSVNAEGISWLQQSVIKCVVTDNVETADESHSSRSPSKWKRRKLFPVERQLSSRKLSVHLQRLPAEVLQCYLTRPTVVLSRLPERVLQCHESQTKNSRSGAATTREVSSEQHSKKAVENVSPQVRAAASSVAAASTNGKLYTVVDRALDRVSGGAETTCDSKDGELRQKVQSSTSKPLSQKHSKTEAQEKSLERGRSRKRSHCKASDEHVVESPKDHNEELVTGEDKNPALKIHSPAAAGVSQNNPEVRSEEKPLKRKRGRPRLHEKCGERSVDRPEDSNEDGVANSALEVHSPASAHKCQVAPEEKTVEKRRGRSRSGHKADSENVDEVKDHKEDNVTKGDKNSSTEVNSPASAHKCQGSPESKSEEKTLEKKRRRSRSGQKAVNENVVDGVKEHSEDALTRGGKSSPSEKSSPTSKSSKHTRTVSEEKSPGRRGGRSSSKKNDSEGVLETTKHHKEGADGNKNSTPEVRSPATAHKCKASPDSKSEERTLEKKRGRSRSGHSAASENAVDGVQNRNRDAITRGDKSSPLEQKSSPTSSATSRKHTKSVSEEKSPGERRGRSGSRKADSESVLDTAKHRSKDADTAGGRKNSASEVHSPASTQKCYGFPESRSEEKTLENKRSRSRSRSRSGHKADGKNVVDRFKDHNEDTVTRESKNSALEKSSPTSSAKSQKHTKSASEEKSLERRGRSGSRKADSKRVLDTTKHHNKDAYTGGHKNSASEKCNGLPESRSEEKTREKKRGRSRSRSGPKTVSENVADRFKDHDEDTVSKGDKSCPPELHTSSREHGKSEPVADTLEIKKEKRKSKVIPAYCMTCKVEHPKKSPVTGRGRKSPHLKSPNSLVAATWKSSKTALEGGDSSAGRRRAADRQRKTEIQLSNGNKESGQEETPVAALSESPRLSRSEPRLDALGIGKSVSSELKAGEEASSPATLSARAGDARNSAHQETPASEASKFRRRAKSESRLEGLEKRNSCRSELRVVLDKVPLEYVTKMLVQKSDHTSKMEDRITQKEERNGHDPGAKSTRKKLDLKIETALTLSDIKSVKRPSSCSSRSSSQIVSKLGSREERRKKKRERNRDLQPQITLTNGDGEYSSVPVVGASENSTQKILPKDAVQISVSEHTEENERHRPHQVLTSSKEMHSELGRLKKTSYKDSNSNKLQDVTPPSPFAAPSYMRMSQKMLESLAPSPSCRSIRSMLSASVTSLNSLSSEGTEFESPAYEPLGSSPVFMPNMRDDHEEMLKTKVTSPSCQSDCCTLRLSHGSTSSPPRMQIQNKSAVRRLSDVFDALPSSPEGGTARRTSEEQGLRCSPAAEQHGDETPCHESDSSYYEEWTKSVREAYQMAWAGFVPKYSKRRKDHKAKSDATPTSGDCGKEVILSQELSPTSPTDLKPGGNRKKKQTLLGWELMQSPPNGDPRSGDDTGDAVSIDVSDSDIESSCSEEDCVITEVRPCSSLSGVLHRSLSRAPGIGTTVIDQSNLGRYQSSPSLQSSPRFSVVPHGSPSLRPEQQTDKSESTKAKVDYTPNSRKRQHGNDSQIQNRIYGSPRLHSKSFLRRCRSASPRLYHVAEQPGSDDDEEDIVEEEEDDDDSVPHGFDPTISRLRQIDKRIEVLENTIPPMNPLWRLKRKSNASHLEGSSVNKVEIDCDEEDSDGDKSVILLDEPTPQTQQTPHYDPVSPNYPPPDVEDKCVSLTMENVAIHNNYQKNMGSPSSSLCGISDIDDGDSFHSVTEQKLTPRKISSREVSSTKASTAGRNSVSDGLSLKTHCRSSCSSQDEETSKINLPKCSASKSQTVIKLRNGTETFHLPTSASSLDSDDTSPIFNRKRKPLYKGDDKKCNGPVFPVSQNPEVSAQRHSVQSVTPDLSTRGTDDVSCRSSSDVQEIEECVSPQYGESSMDEGEPVRRLLKTPTKLRILRLPTPKAARRRHSPYSSQQGQHSAESSPKKRHSVSRMENVMFLHLFNEIRRMPPSEENIKQLSLRLPKERTRHSSVSTEEDDAENAAICVDALHSSGDSEGLDDEQKDTDSEVVAEGFGLQITRADLATLSGTNWLNDKIVNFYLKLVTERGRQNKEPEVYAYDTFFFPKLNKFGYQSVKKWTRVIDVFKHDVLIIPVHLGTHWCMAAVDFRKQTLVYYDSMGGNNESCLMTIWHYLSQESAERSVEPLSDEVWEIRCAKDIPMQSNNSDCGVFMCKYAECITRDAELDFSQSDMPEIRKEMMEEITSMKLLRHRL